MRSQDLFAISSQALLINKSRSVLTMLGIVIGIASVILMLGVGQAAQNYLLSQIASFGSDLVFVANGRGDDGQNGPPSATEKQTLTEKDYKKIKALTWARAVNPSVVVSERVMFGGEEKLTRVSGTTADELLVYNMTMARGRFIEQDDVDSRARVVALGRDVADKLFGQDDPIGQRIKMGSHTYRVIGILSPAGTRFFSNADDQVYAPFTTIMDTYNRKNLNFISIKTGEVGPREAQERIRIALRESHNLDNPEGKLSKDDFQVATQEDTIRSADTIGTVLQVLLGSIASISLFVAGIGIMNIMYVTVTERTKEIGLRKAIGAKRKDILGQFLSEAVMLTVIAGFIGIIFGLILTWLGIFIISQFQTGWSFVLPLNGVIMGFSVAFGVGIVFGYFPAKKAANMNPIEALRYE